MKELKITGRIREKESGLGVSGLHVRAYDKDMLFDDLLGSAVTDEKGFFEMYYSDKDFKELFENRPDIYLAIYAPPMRLLLDTKGAVRWEASNQEHFDLEIDRETLGDLSPTLPDDAVEGGVRLSKDALAIQKRDGFDLPKLKSFRYSAIPGRPAVPELVQYMALPLGGDILSLEIIPGEPVVISAEKPFPVQEPVPDVGTDSRQFGDGFSIDNIDIKFTTMAPAFLKGQKAFPEKLVEVLKTEEIGPIQMAAIRVNPVQYDPVKKAYNFYPNLRYVAKFDLEKAKKIAASRKHEASGVGELYAEQIESILSQKSVLRAKDLKWATLFLEDVPYLIVADNYRWPESIQLEDGATRAPNLTERGAALSGDLVAEYQRLAEWKTSRGIRTMVITISDIVGKKFGDFTQGGFARDLQEVLRNAFKYFHKQKDTLYVLLGGDTSVAPIRNLTGSSTYETIGCWRHTDNPPPERTCYFLSGHSAVKLFPLFQPEATDPLSTQHGGLRIPFDREAGAGRLGWYFTSKADFETKNTGFKRLGIGEKSRYIIVEGPEAVLDDNFYWLRPVNSIPSDFYYSSLEGPGYSIPGKHDFDDNNNGLYGQYHFDGSMEVSLDRVDFWPDIWVGRASAESQAEASAFVNKVMAYEKLEDADGNDVDTSYLHKILYASAYWGRKWQQKQSDTASPPAEDKFTHVNGSNVTKVHTSFDLSMSGGLPSHRMVARLSGADVVIPYNTAADTSNLGWFFVTNDSYSVQSAPPTRYVKVMGPEADINAVNFFWDPMGLELCVQEKENLRALMNTWYPNFNSVERHYEDYFDLSTPPPLVPLDSSVVQAALNNGVHLASLSGHGSPYGCCGVNSGMDFSNNRKFYIMFANSCSTARPDGVDSLAEKSTLDPDGGAIGYVGNTRYGWIGVGDNYEEFFWDKLSVSGRLGPAAGMRLATGGVRQFWTFYTQTLFGDPEMPVWTDSPKFHEVTYPKSAEWGDTVEVTVRHMGVAVANRRVTLMGGWAPGTALPKVFMTKKTNSLGKASFSLPADGLPLSELNLTVTYSNFKPFLGTITMEEVGEVRSRVEEDRMVHH
ncbi:MAG: hypothetical protein H6566_11060 [Lewinellaceae bacterium]|nr:hypothetical protein [Lewinellaceae bacterium]